MVNFLVPLLEPLSFRLRCISFLLSKLCFIIKVSTIYGAGRDTTNPCHKFNSQGLALRILGLMVICPKFQGPISRVLCVRVPCPRFPESQSHGSQGLRPGSQGPGSQVSGPDFRLCQLQEHLNFSKHFYACSTIMMSQVQKIFIQSHFESTRSVVKKINMFF